MVAIQFGVGLVFLGLSVHVMIGSIDLEYFTDVGPGPGFFPFWLGAIMATLTTVWLIKVYFGPRAPIARGLIPSREGALRLLAVLGALVFYAAFSEVLGFRLTMLAFLMFILYVPGQQPLILSAVIAVIGSFGSYFLFHDLLGIHLPFASISALEDLGL